MSGLEITKKLKNDIEENQNNLQEAIRNHKKWILKLKAHPFEEDLIHEVKYAEDQIVLVGLKQKNLLKRLREEYQVYQKTLKQNVVTTALEERRFNLSNVLGRARNQHISLVRPPSAHSYSDDSEGRRSINSSPEHGPKPINPHDVTQSKFLNYFCLVTHDIFKEMQNKRAERKRRSTANPHFLYGNKGWDFMGPAPKRKRRQFLARPISPPNTRQSSRKRQGRSSPPSTGTEKGPVNGNGNHYPSTSVFGNFSSVGSGFPAIPNLPSGLVIERISSDSGSPDPKLCVCCKQPDGVLQVCNACLNSFHVSCHNRPLAQTPRHCPKCIDRERQRLRVKHSVSVLCLPTQEYTEKLSQKKELEEKHHTLTAELTQLQHRHSQLTVSLRKQQSDQEKLLLNQQTTESKVNQILQFIEKIKNSNFVSNSASEGNKIEENITSVQEGNSNPENQCLNENAVSES